MLPTTINRFRTPLADLDNGVLTVLLPKVAEAKPKQIEVAVK